MGFLLLIAFALLAVLLIAAGGIAHRLRHPPRLTYATALGRGLPTTPDELGRPGEAVTLRLTDGRNTPAWLIPGDNPAGPTVVLLHGFADSRYKAATWAHLLWPHASQLLMFDLPGHGESASPICHLGTREADDLIHLLDQIDSARGVVLFGYSMGAGIAIAAAARRDPRIVGVIADGPYRRWHEPVANILHARRWPVRVLLPIVSLYLRLLSPRWQPYDRAEQARQLDCPLLVLHGCRDALCHNDHARAIAAAAPRSRLVEFPEGRHLDLAHVDESRYRTALQSFFDELNPPEPKPKPHAP